MCFKFVFGAYCTVLCDFVCVVLKQLGCKGSPSFIQGEYLKAAPRTRSRRPVARLPGAGFTVKQLFFKMFGSCCL